MEIPASLDIVSRLADGNAGEQRASGQLGREAFLELLISQLTNQDPLSPLQDHEFVAQLATFSNLEQLELLNEQMQASLLMDQSVNNSLATNLIGKEVLADSSSLVLGEDDGASFVLELAADAHVTVLVRDENGDLVRRLEPGDLKVGPNTIEWDGSDESGQRAAPGDYAVEILATDANGTTVASRMQIRAEVTGVRFVDGTGYLMVGDTSIPLANVVEVFGGAG